VAHAKAVEILKQATGAVSLRVVSWPGTMVWVCQIAAPIDNRTFHNAWNQLM
jgi:hypothetical protein